MTFSLPDDGLSRPLSYGRPPNRERVCARERERERERAREKESGGLTCIINKGSVIYWTERKRETEREREKVMNCVPDSFSLRC